MTTPGSADARSAHRADPTKKNVLILALCQAFGMTGNAMVITVSALVGFDMAVDKGLATLPLALQFTATMIGTIPASLLMRRIGRRAGFSLGASVGCIGGATAAYAIASGSFALFCLAAMLNGVFHAFILYYRFAAADTASETFRPRAISLVMAGGVVAAIAGPELAKWSRGLFAPALFVGSYAAIAGLAAVSLVLLQFVDIPRLSAAERARSGRPLGVILRQPKCVTAILSAAVGYAVMSLVMTATPLAMVAHHFDFDAAAFVIQWHGLAMFLPSFFTGQLIQRFGAVRIISVGIAMNVASLAINLSGVEFLQFWAALVLLGLGWNFMFVGGTALLTEVHTPAERGKTQAVNDFLVFTTVSLAAFSSGALHSSFGWTAVNLGMAPPLLIALTAVVWLIRRRPRPV